MPQNPEPTDIRSELIQLLSEEFVAGGIPNSVVAGDGIIPTQMMIALAADRQKRIPTVHIYFLPLLEDPPVMQYMVPLDYDIANHAMADLARFIIFVNANLPVTGFEFNEASGVILFRHTHAISTQPLDPGVVAWTLEIIRYAVEIYGQLIEKVAGGGDYEEAVGRFAENIASI
jgi:hypothetical protein